MQESGEILLRVGDYFLEEDVGFFRGQLHYFAGKVNYPYNFLFLLEHVLTEEDQPLHGVAQQDIILQVLWNFVILYHPYPVQYNHVRILVATQNSMWVDLLQLLYFRIGQFVLL